MSYYVKLLAFTENTADCVKRWTASSQQKRAVYALSLKIAHWCYLPVRPTHCMQYAWSHAYVELFNGRSFPQQVMGGISFPCDLGNDSLLVLKNRPICHMEIEDSYGQRI